MSEPALENYLKEAASWDADRAAQRRRVLRMACWAAGAGWLCAVMGVAAVMFLTPLKHVEPFVIRVDNTSGLVDVVPIYTGKGELPETLTRHLLTLYITTCERFNFATAESDYDQCGAFNTAERNQAWAASWARTNPASPLNLYKDGTTIRAQVRSISFLKRANGVGDLAQVRYLKVKRAGGSGADQVSYWVATIQYAYVDRSGDLKKREWREQELKQRHWNQFNFRIIDFRPEPEVLGEDAPAAIPSVTAAAQASAQAHVR